MKTSDIITYEINGFDAQKYYHEQKQAIIDRVQQAQWRVYLEVGGKLFWDAHAARVLPWFDPEVKQKIFHDLAPQADLIFCVNYDDIVANRQLSNEQSNYIEFCFGMVQQLKDKFGITPIIAINKYVDEGSDLSFFEKTFATYKIFKRKKIWWYPHDLKHILSDQWFGQDEYIPVTKNLVIVTWAASNSGKLSTALGQVYRDIKQWMQATYAKYETFPIRNIPLDHPINCAYEAATADIGDYNVVDHYHQKAYGVQSVNYNRDIDAFEIIEKIAQTIAPAWNLMRSYRSPTDMGINKAWFAITNDIVCMEAAIQEIIRRKQRYQQIFDQTWQWKNAIEACEVILKKAQNYYNNKKL